MTDQLLHGKEQCPTFVNIYSEKKTAFLLTCLRLEPLPMLILQGNFTCYLIIEVVSSVEVWRFLVQKSLWLSSENKYD